MRLLFKKSINISIEVASKVNECYFSCLKFLSSNLYTFLLRSSEVFFFLVYNSLYYGLECVKLWSIYLQILNATNYCECHNLTGPHDFLDISITGSSSRFCHFFDQHFYIIRLLKSNYPIKFFNS